MEGKEEQDVIRQLDYNGELAGYLAELQKDFIFRMKPHFGLMLVAPLDIVLNDRGINRLYMDKKFFGVSIDFSLSDQLYFDGREEAGIWLYRRGFRLAHELGRLFHCLANPDFFKGAMDRRTKTSDGSGWRENDKYLMEFVANVAAIEFSCLRGEFNRIGFWEFCRNYSEPMPHSSNLWPVFMFFRDNSGGLEHSLNTLSTAGGKEAEEIAGKYRQYFNYPLAPPDCLAEITVVSEEEIAA